MIGAYHGEARAVGGEHYRVAGNAQPGFRFGGGEADLRVHSGVERAGGVGSFENYQHGARGGVERIRNVGDARREDLAGALLHAQLGELAVVDLLHVGLWDVDEDAQGRDFGDAEHFLGRAGVAGVDERSDIHVARGDDAVERRGRPASHGIEICSYSSGSENRSFKRRMYSIPSLSIAVSPTITRRVTVGAPSQKPYSSNWPIASRRHAR